MKTAKFNGNNVAKLEFDYFIRYRPRHNVYILGMEKQVKKLFEDIRYNHICYTWENDITDNLKHSHCLVKTPYGEDLLIENLKKNIVSSKNIISGSRNTTYTSKLNLLNPNTGQRISKLVEHNALIDYKEIIGKHGSVFIEQVKDKTSASIYTMKFTDYGANFGYIKGDLI